MLLVIIERLVKGWEFAKNNQNILRQKEEIKSIDGLIRMNMLSFILLMTDENENRL